MPGAMPGARGAARSVSVDMFSGVVMLLGGLSNGYSGAITGGAVSRLKPELRMTALQEALFQSALFVGMGLGCLVGAELAEELGRRRATFASETIVFCFGGIQALIDSVPVLIVLRVLLGIGLGGCCLIKPLYISEIASPERCGLLLGLFSFAYSGGLLVALMVDEWLPKVPGAWRLELSLPPMLSASLLAGIVFLFLPDSPHSRAARAAASSGKVGGSRSGGGGNGSLNGGSDTGTALTRRNTIAMIARGWTLLYGAHRSSPTGKALRLSWILVTAYQLTGMPLIMTATREFHRLGGLAEGAELGTFSVATGVVHLAGVGIGVVLLTQLGRRVLYLRSLGTMLIALLAMAVAYAWPSPPGSHAASTMPLVRSSTLIAVVLCFQFGMAPGFWVISTEIFPDEVRAHGMGVLYATVFVCGVLSVAVRPLIVSRSSVTGFAVVSFGIGAWAFRALTKRLPETRGVPVAVLWQDATDASSDDESDLDHRETQSKALVVGIDSTVDASHEEVQRLIPSQL